MRKESEFPRVPRPRGYTLESGGQGLRARTSGAGRLTGHARAGGSIGVQDAAKGATDCIARRYNSPIEACVATCHTAKPKPRKGRILLINAVNEVTRERAQSFLTDEHIERSVKAHARFKDQPGLTCVATAWLSIYNPLLHRTLPIHSFVGFVCSCV